MLQSTFLLFRVYSPRNGSLGGLSGGNLHTVDLHVYLSFIRKQDGRAETNLPLCGVSWTVRCVSGGLAHSDSKSYTEKSMLFYSSQERRVNQNSTLS